jgi:hypothetical protein
MAQKYIHYFGNESSESLLEAYEIATKNRKSADILAPKICPNEYCKKPNAKDARFCSKCKMIMSFEGYQQASEEQKKKEAEAQILKEKYEQDMKSMREEMENKFQQILAKIDTAKLT